MDDIATPTYVFQRKSIYKMPSMQIDKFDGSSKKWPAFWASFSDLIDADPTLTTTQRMAMLQRCLTQEVQDSLGDSLLNPEMYAEAIEMLKSLYGNPYLISRTYIRSLMDLPRVSHINQYAQLLSFSNSIIGAVRSLKNSGYEHELDSSAILESILDKLPNEVRSKWGKKLVKSGLEPLTLRDFAPFLQEIVRAEMMVKHTTFNLATSSDGKKREDKRPGRDQKDGKKTGRPDSATWPPTVLHVADATATASATVVPTSSVPLTASSGRFCPHCDSKSHDLAFCSKFKAMDLTARADVVKRHGLCLQCLKKGHLKSDCAATKKCGVSGCKFGHHQLLHGAPLIFKKGKKDDETKDPAINAVSGPAAILLPIVPVWICNGSKRISTFALLDGGSEGTLILRSTAEDLGLNGTVKRSRLATFHGHDPEIEVKMVNFVVASRDETVSYSVNDAFAVPSLSISSRSFDVDEAKKNWPHLSGLHLPSTDSGLVTVLLGRDVSGVHKILASRDPPTGGNGPELIQTPFGWCPVGPVSVPPPGPASTARPPHVNKISRPSTDDELRESLTKFWTSESMGIIFEPKPRQSEADQRAIRILEETARHNGERWEIGLLTSRDDFKLPDNLATATQRWKSLERRWKKDPEYATRYHALMNANIISGHAELVKFPEQNPPDNVWYLPHHGAVKHGKLRVVLDCACRTEGVCLNSFLLKGPDLSNGQLDILLRFRLPWIVVTCDIEKMFYQVLLQLAQRPLFRFLYRAPDEDGPPRIYQMTVHPFGATSSPTVCTYALQKTARLYQDQYPAAAKALLEDAYVDNVFHGCDTEEEAITFVRDVKEISRLGGFNQRAFMSSSRSVLATVPPEDRAKSVLDLDLDAECLPVERLLGNFWDAETDEFAFNFTDIEHHSVAAEVRTMREMLGQLAKVYDPMGLISLVVLPGKILMQDCFRAGLKWDDPLPEPLVCKWKAWVMELQHLKKLRIPRCVRRRPAPPIEFELHGFCDASELAFGACIYLRVKYGPDDYDAHLLMGKTRVAPLRQLTIPRMELQAALALVRMMIKVIKALEGLIQFARIALWGDSMTVLAWLKSLTVKFHAFVANRVTEILEAFPAEFWNHISGLLNPADDASRGLPASALHARHRWIKGAAQLCQPDSKWPSAAIVSEPDQNDPEVTPVCWTGALAVTETSPIVALTERLTNLSRLKRTVAWMLRFAVLARKRTPPSPWLSVADLRSAQLAIVRADQDNYFSREIETIRSGKMLPGDSPLIQLTPFLDADGLLRVGGRLGRCPALGESSKHPTIVHSKSAFGRLLIHDAHLQAGHAGVTRTIGELNPFWYILRYRHTVRLVVKRCMDCRKRKTSPAVPLMAALPRCRLQSHSPPFTQTGIDYFGPFEVVQGRSRIKRYGVLFTCLVTRAVHIEIASSLDTDSFLMAFWRFAERRGYPEHCYSDNGTNLTAGEKGIRAIVEAWNQEKINDQLALKGISWHFNPPAAPHFGGSWERLVSSAKSALRIILRRRAVSEEVLTTAMVLVEGLINGRPLTHVSIDPTDMEPLTPNHFLIGRANPGFHPPDLTGSDDVHPRDRFRAAQDLATHFWNRWMKEYLPRLIERRKWLGAERNLAVDDIVLVVENNAPRGSWPLGRVIEVHRGDDGVVRSGLIRFRETELVRPVEKLCLLEADEELVSSPQKPGPAV